MGFHFFDEFVDEAVGDFEGVIRLGGFSSFITAFIRWAEKRTDIRVNVSTEEFLSSFMPLSETVLMYGTCGTLIQIEERAFALKLMERINPDGTPLIGVTG